MKSKFTGYAIAKDNVMIAAICLLLIQTVLLFLMCVPIDKALKEKFGESIETVRNR